MRTPRDHTASAPVLSSRHNEPSKGAVGAPVLLAAKIALPRQRSGTIERPRLARKLLGALEHPLTIVRAEAGYGKTTALSHLAGLVPRSAWYGLTDADRDPLVFLTHLLAAVERTSGIDLGRSRAVLEQEGGAVKHWAAAIDTLANDLHGDRDDDRLVILDDFHLVIETPIERVVDRLVEHAPSWWHVVLGTRDTPRLPRMARRTATGGVLDIGKEALAFADDETCELYWERHGDELPVEAAQRLVAECDGWPIALNLLTRAPVDAEHRQRPERREELFEYLAQEVYESQTQEVKDFLLGACVLHRLEPEVCDELLERDDSAERLAALERQSLFVFAVDESTWRLQTLFMEFLLRALDQDTGNRAATLHRRAATIMRRRGRTEDAIHHALAAGSGTTAADLLEGIAADLVVAGRYETLRRWIDALPQDVLQERPELLRANGDALRLTSRFEEAIDNYRRARALFAGGGDGLGEARALESEALVYLDTVRPASAGPLLRRALKLIDDEDRSGRAHLLHLLAENSANHGDLERAERIERAARALDGDAAAPPDPRLPLRRGRLAEAQAMAERQLRHEQSAESRGVPRSHRESTAVLSWIAAFYGDAAQARDYAQKALDRGRDMHAPIVEALALCRLGHSFLCGPTARPEQAMDLYADSLSLSERIAVDRFRAEALLGQVVAYGIQGKVEHARAVAGEAVAILEAAGDQYLAAIVWLALGAAATQASRPEAAQWIDTGTRLAARAGDGYCLCVGDLWRSIGALEAEDWDTFDVSIGRLLVQAHEQGYACLLTAQPFLGVHDRRVLVELLGAAARRGIQQGSARRLLAEIAPADARRLDDPARYHAKLLGAFELVEGTRAVAGDAWGRDKALALFQFLVVHRGRAVHREQIQEALWPGSRPDASALGLRVALSALHRAVEPARGKAESPTLVRREGPTLKLDAALLRCDLDEFEEALAEARSAEAAGDVLGSLDCLRSALSIYRGDLLEDRPYDEWVAEHRRPLRGSYLRAGIRAATLLADLGDTDEAIEVCERLIADEPAFEEPYALLMRLHARAGNRALATRTFDRCLAALGDVAASKEILGLRDAIATGTS